MKTKKNSETTNENIDFSDKVAGLGSKGIKIMDGYFDGEEINEEMIKYASKTIGQTITALNMKRVGQYQERSLALRLLKFLPADEKFRNKYIQATNPQIKPLMLSMPKR